MTGADVSVAEQARSALAAAGGDPAWAAGVLRRWVEANPTLRQQVIAWGCAAGWWTPSTWGADNGVWDLALGALIDQAKRQFAALPAKGSPSPPKPPGSAHGS